MTALFLSTTNLRTVWPYAHRQKIAGHSASIKKFAHTIITRPYTTTYEIKFRGWITNIQLHL